MKGCNVKDRKSSNHKGKKVVKAKESVQGCVIHGKPSPQPDNNVISYNRNNGCKAGNHRCSPQRHLPPRQDIPDKGCQNHQKKENNPKNPHEFSWTCVGPIIESSKNMNIDDDEKHSRSICVKIPEEPPSFNISHNMLNARKGKVHVGSIMHCKEDSTCNLDPKADSCKRSESPHIGQI